MRKNISCLVLVALIVAKIYAAGDGSGSLKARLVLTSFYEPVSRCMPSDMWFDFRDDREAEYVYVLEGRDLMTLDFKTLMLRSANGSKLSAQQYEIDNYYTKISRDGRFATFAVRVKNAALDDGAGISGEFEIECYESVNTNQCTISKNGSRNYEFKGLKASVKSPKDSDQKDTWSVETKSEGKLLSIGVSANGKSLMPSAHAEFPCSGNGSHHCWYFKFPEGAEVKMTTITPSTTARKKVTF